MIAGTKMFSGRSAVSGRFVAIMHHSRDDRELVPAQWQTRCILAGEIHELILCQPGDNRAEKMNYVSYLGFVEILAGGIVAVGDQLQLADRVIGAVHGFDEIHFPNHYNILVASSQLYTGAEIGLHVGDSVTFSASARSALDEQGPWGALAMRRLGSVSNDR